MLVPHNIVMDLNNVMSFLTMFHYIAIKDVEYTKKYQNIPRMLGCRIYQNKVVQILMLIGAMLFLYQTGNGM